ncbi:uncharacterized protein ACR2FA_008379 [Aphomia sociella]
MRFCHLPTPLRETRSTGWEVLANFVIMFSIFGKNLPQLQDILISNGYIDKLYEAIRHEDAVSAMKVALDIVHRTKIVPATKMKRKSIENANVIYEEAENAIIFDELDVTFEKCNEILTIAPKYSEEIFLAYYLRINVLKYVKAPVAGLNDIETCFSLTRPSFEVLKTLLENREELSQLLPFEKFKNLTIENSFGRHYFAFNVKRHKDIPCVSADVTVVRENGQPKIVAAKNMEIGELVAIERAFVTDQNDKNTLISCYYCLKFSLNLIPCDGCCYALFCDEICKKFCMEECHKTECQIMDYIYSAATTSRSRLSVRAALKIKQSKSWDEVIAVSRNLGADKMTSSTDGEIYNSHNTLSMLHFNRRKHFVHGKMFNQSLLYATIVDKLSCALDFYPRDHEKKLEAMCALGSIMVDLYIHFPFEIKILNAAQNYITTEVFCEPMPNFGWCSFASKLTHCCEPNLLAVGLNDKIALVVLKPIKKGEEFTICHMGHYYENVLTEGRQLKMFTSLERVCECIVCINNWTNRSGKPGKLNDDQKRCIRVWQATVTTYPERDSRYFRETCHAMSMLQGLANTTEHQMLFGKFRDTLKHFQYSVTQNNVIMKSR